MRRLVLLALAALAAACGSDTASAQSAWTHYSLQHDRFQAEARVRMVDEEGWRTCAMQLRIWNEHGEIQMTTLACRWNSNGESVEMVAEFIQESTVNPDAVRNLRFGGMFQGRHEVEIRGEHMTIDLGRGVDITLTRKREP